MIKTMKPLSHLGHTKAREVMSAPVITVHVWDSIHNVAKIFVENNISAAPVVNMEGLPLGVITKTDLARYDQEQASLVVAEINNKDRKNQNIANGYHLEPEETTIESWMTPVVFDVHPETPLLTVMKKMVSYGLHHIFVTDKKTHRIEGIITTFDLLQFFTHQILAE